MSARVDGLGCCSDCFGPGYRGRGDRARILAVQRTSPPGAAFNGDHIDDSSGLSHDGEVFGSLNYITGAPGATPMATGTDNAFEGTDLNFPVGNYIVLDADPVYAFTDSFTYETMIRTTNSGTLPGDREGLMRSFNSTSGEEWWMRTAQIPGGTAGHFGINAFLYDGADLGEVEGQIRVNDGQWHHVAMVYDDPLDELRLYVDYQLDVTATGLGAVDTVGGAIVNPTIGSFNGANLFGGDMEFGRLNSGVLAPSEFVIPEPSSAMMLCLGILSLALARRYRRS